MPIARNPFVSHLDDTGLPMSREVENGVLGDHYQRKNRGRYQVVSGTEGVRLLDVQGDDQLACELGVSASIRPVGGTTPALQSILPPVVLDVVWGTDGAWHAAEVDLVQGSCFSVAASSLDVSARLVDGDDPSVQVALSLGYGHNQAVAQRTLSGVIAAPNGAITFRVPPFARRVEIVRASAADNTDMTVRILDRTGTVIGQVRSDGVIDLPLPNAAAQVQVEDVAGSAPVEVSAVYRLSL